MTRKAGRNIDIETTATAAGVKSYISPYSQAKSRGVIKRKPGKIKGISVKTKVGDSVDSGPQIQRHRTVDELMKRISTKQQGTICVSDSRLRDKENEEESSMSVVKKAPCAGNEGSDPSSAFLTSGVDGDEFSVGSGVLSAGSFGSYGSFGSLKSAISVFESQVARGSKKIKTFEVDIQTKNGTLIRQKRSLQSLINDIESNARDNDLPPVFVPHFDEMPETMISWNGKNNLKPSKKMIERQKRKDEKARMLKTTKKSADSDHSNLKQQLPQTGVLASREATELDDDDVTVDDDLGSVGSSVGFADSSLEFGDSKAKKKRHVDIIGMYQAVPLILARADERCRKREKAIAAKNQVSEEKRRALMELIRHKMSRSERYAEALRHNQLCIAWLTLIPAIIYNHTFSRIYPPIFHIHSRNKEEFWAIMVLTRVVKKFINYKMEKKIRGEFLAKIQSSFWILSMAVRAKRRQFAVKKIKFFFSLFKGKNRIKFVVHRFVQSAHMMQRAIRSFIMCTRSRVESLLKVWNDVECAYILDILEKRRREQGSLLAGIGGGGKDGDQDIVAKIDGKMKIEMQKQADRWKESEAKMDALLQRHRNAGLIDKVNLQEVAQKMVLDVPEKHDIISAYIRTRRRIYITEKDEAMRKIMKESQTFAVTDATDLLQGNTEKINNTVRLRMAMIRRYGTTSFGMPLFDDNNTIDQVKDMFRTNIERMHKKAGTFVIKDTKKKKLKRNRSSRKSIYN